MIVNIDTTMQTIELDGKSIPLFSDHGFRALSDLWVKVGWNQKYSYSFSWLGTPIIQLPEDMIRYQEVINRVRPDVIIETGVAHGGSAVFSASLCRLLGKGRVIAIDIEIRPPARTRVESHPLKDLITLIEGSSIAKNVVEKVKSLVRPGETVLVVLDSDHSYQHVSAEINAYHNLVSVDSYIVATDGIIQDLEDVPRGKSGWAIDNSAKAARDFAAKNPEFVIEQPKWPFNESTLTESVTYWPGAWLKRVR